jgi:hypothetical protein
MAQYTVRNGDGGGGASAWRGAGAPGTRLHAAPLDQPAEQPPPLARRDAPAHSSFSPSRLVPAPADSLRRYDGRFFQIIVNPHEVVGRSRSQTPAASKAALPPFLPPGTLCDRNLI